MSEKPEPTVSRETKNKPSSFYLYLLILFGAAFLMLLLAYFVQRRNNETVQDNLRTTIASREELLDQIEALEEEKRALQEERDGLQQELKSTKEQLESLGTRFDYLMELHTQEIIDHRDQVTSWADVWALEQSFRAKDYQGCAEWIKNLSTPKYYTYTTPESAQARYDEIYQFLDERGYLKEDAPAGQSPEGGGG